MDSHHKRVLNESRQWCHVFVLFSVLIRSIGISNVSSTTVISLIKHEKNRAHKM